VLGSGPGGSTQTIAALCAKRKITLKRLPTSRESRMSGEARSLLSNGRLREAIQLVGRPPVWSRPRSGKLRLAWRVGDYLAVPLPEPTAQPSGAPLHVHLEAVDHQPAILRWPDPDIRWLAFVGTSTARPSDRST